MEFDSETALQIGLSFAIGTAIGLEREYRSKAAGLRTMIMICVGSTLFTQVSISMSELAPERIASNIITGIGFLGAGVIFKDGLSINGITTATTIWISAALGMAVGGGEYFVALVGSVIVLIVLSLLETFQKLIARAHQARSYKITFRDDGNFIQSLEEFLKESKLTFHKARDGKSESEYMAVYEVSGSEKKLEKLNSFLKERPQVCAYEY